MVVDAQVVEVAVDRVPAGTGLVFNGCFGVFTNIAITDIASAECLALRYRRLWFTVDVNRRGSIVKDTTYVVPLSVVHAPATGVVNLSGIAPHMPADLACGSDACSDRQTPVFVAVKRGDELTGCTAGTNPGADAHFRKVGALIE